MAAKPIDFFSMFLRNKLAHKLAHNLSELLYIGLS